MLVDSLLVESVHLRRLGASAAGDDFVGDTFDGRLLTPGKKDVGVLARKGACDGAADSASRSVDHRDLVMQQHVRLFPFSGRFDQSVAGIDPTRRETGRLYAAQIRTWP